MRPSKMRSKAVSCTSAMTDPTLPYRSKRPMLPSEEGHSAEWRTGTAQTGAGRSPRRRERLRRVDTSGGDAGHDADNGPVKGGRLRSISRIVIFDIAAPLAAYYLLRSAGLTAVEALLISGVFPALGVGIGALQN